MGASISQFVYFYLGGMGPGGGQIVPFLLKLSLNCKKRPLQLLTSHMFSLTGVNK